MSGDPLTAEYERNLRRDHERGHPGGLTPISKRPCTICLLLAQLSHERNEVARLRDGLRLEAEFAESVLFWIDRPNSMDANALTAIAGRVLASRRALLAEDGAAPRLQFCVCDDTPCSCGAVYSRGGAA